MHLKFRLPLAIFATVVIVVSNLLAQADDDDEDEFSTMGFFSRSPETLKVGLTLSQAPKVQFGNLGSVPSLLPQPGAGVVGRLYMDGTVNYDAPRPYVAGSPQNEYSADRDRLSPTGGRYIYYNPSDPTQPMGNYLSYAPGVTRNWSYNNQSQATTNPGSIAFDIYSANSQGATFAGSHRITNGVELSAVRALTNPSKRVHFSFVAGVALNGINSKKSATVTSSLHTYTDLYSLNGLSAPVTPLNTDGTSPTPGVQYTGPSFVTDSTTGLVTETTQVLSTLPTQTISTDTPDGAVVTGLWKLKGAYFTLKLGPEVTANLTRSLALNASAGVAGSYVGTTYTANETFSVVGIASPLTTGDVSTSKNTFLPGYYANIDATWTLNERSGFFAGVSYDNLGEYNQSVGGRTAKVDLSATAGVRGGLSIKF